MNKKNISVFFLILSVFINIFFVIHLYNKSDSNINLDRLSKYEKENLIGDLYPIKNIDIESKKNIAKNLFEEYLNQNSTDWKNVNNNNIQRNPLPTFTNYRITDVIWIKENNNQFTVDIIYDIQYTDNGKQWVAGDGDLADDNWVLKKDFLVDVIRYKDKFLILDVYH